MPREAPLSPAREQEIRESVPTVYGPPWTVDPDMEDGTWRVLYATDHPLAGLVAQVPDYGSHLAEFIATAREAVPELLDEIDRLRDELAEVKAPRTGRCYLNGDVLFLSEAVIPHPITQEPHVVGWTRKTDERDWKPTALAHEELKCNAWQDITVQDLDDPEDETRA
ncbi:hypothetical protein AB0D27_11325 [Streptomyces sp. NPDC048415]|uniref:hypothetical protein n=1 Tax=Streptomyces sp. NPDC048415 TaxID=3154822 RepID=UPI00341C5D99